MTFADLAAKKAAFAPKWHSVVLQAKQRLFTHYRHLDKCVSKHFASDLRSKFYIKLQSVVELINMSSN